MYIHATLQKNEREKEESGRKKRKKERRKNKRAKLRIHRILYLREKLEKIVNNC